MKASSSYDYSQITIEGKFSDDWNYILNGDKGNPFSRGFDLMRRDWNASSTSDKVGIALSVTPFRVFRVGGITARMEITFGRNANQIFHAFRHTRALGLSDDVVRAGVLKSVPRVISKVPNGYPLNVITKINGVRVQYSIFKTANGSYNIGRIHGAF
ncbi:MAG: Cell wall-associated polypeptide [Bacteroidota bacterium]|jgi:hypothetical protein